MSSPDDEGGVNALLEVAADVLARRAADHTVPIKLAGDHAAATVDRMVLVLPAVDLLRRGAAAMRPGIDGR